MNEKIIFSFGFRSKETVAVLPTLNDLAQEYPLRYLLISNPDGELDELDKAKKKYNFIDLQVKALSLDELYDYLHASDVLLIHRESSQKYPAVLSSSVCQLLGSGCPILFHQSNYVELQGNEIVKYSNFEDMKIKLKRIFQGKFDLNIIKSFLKKYEAERVAEKFIKLFKELGETQNQKRRVR